MSSQVPSRFLPFSGEFPATSADTFDFDESDLWLSQSPSGDALGKAELVTKKPNARAPRRAKQTRTLQSASMPVKMPAWGRIGVASTRLMEENEEDCDHGEDELVQVKKEKPRSPTWMPPHEYLARRWQQQGTVCCSMEEGVGGTLKGRELWRVRDAIWKKTGFQD